MITTKKIKMKIKSLRYEVEESLFAKVVNDIIDSGENYENDDLAYDEEQEISLNTEGFMNLDGDRVEIVYEESEITGMEGSRTSVVFDKSNSGLVSMLRDGSVSTALVFEKGKRHHCVYNTPIMPFEICVRTLRVENNVLDEGRLKLDYIIEIRGAKAERTKFELEIKEN